MAPAPISDHRLKLLQGGGAFFPALISAIDASQREVRLETYIFYFDDTGVLVAQALERAAQRGVGVYLMMDGIGTPGIPESWVTRFKAAGVVWHRFAPLGQWGLLIPGGWRRLHRKLCAVDEVMAFCGGINILDDLFDPYFGVLDSPRFDFAVQIQGPMVADVYRTMVLFWERAHPIRRVGGGELYAAKPKWSRSLHRDPGTAASEREAQLVLRDNLLNRNRIERAYLKAIGDARQEVLIANAYFLPGGKLRRALVHAAHRGVRVRLLLQGRYENFMQFHASRPILGVLLAAGVEIHEYSGGFLHAKVAVIDGVWSTVGSSNLDPLSLLLAREANVVVQNPAFAEELRTCLTNAMQTHSVKLDSLRYSSRRWRWVVLDWFAYGVMRLLLFASRKRY
jgi:cardiolipin synthase